MLLFTLIVLLIIASLITYAFNRPVGFVVMQVTLAIAVVFGVYTLSLWVLRRDQLVADDNYKVNDKTKTVIINGYADSHNLAYTVIDTTNPSSLSYAAIPRSINRLGGAQFTYQFWMLISDPLAVKMADILVKGDIVPYNIMALNNTTNEVIARQEDIMIKCPRIRFNGAFNQIAVEVNTISSPNPVPLEITSTRVGTSSSEDNTLRQNVLKLGLNRWMMYTFVFRDHVAINDFEDGIEVTLYVNDMLFQTLTLQSALRQNIGNLYLFPSGAVSGLRIGNLAYYNYALTLEDVDRDYKAGAPTSLSITTDYGTNVSPLYLTEYNKLNIYNA